MLAWILRSPAPVEDLAEYAIAHQDAVFSFEGIPLPEEQLAPVALCRGRQGCPLFASWKPPRQLHR